MTYWHEDPLNFCLPFRYSNGFKYTCFHCGKEFQIKPSFFCTKCNIDLCVECLVKYIDGFHDSNIRLEKNSNIINNDNNEKCDYQLKIDRHSHTLTKCFLLMGEYNENYCKCSICEKNLQKFNIIYLCSLCDIKYCENCINKIK